MLNLETEESMKSQYANWHPTPEARELQQDQELTDLEAGLERGEAALLEYVKKTEPEESEASKIRNRARKFYEEYSPVLNAGIRQVNKFFEQGDYTKAESLGGKLIGEIKKDSAQFLTDKVREYFKEYDQDQSLVAGESEPIKKTMLYKLAMEAIDFIPVVGSAKMIGEGLAGRTMSGEKLSKGKRMIHTTEGAVFLALDLTGVGIVEAEGMKSGRLVTRSAALMRKMGMAEEIYKPVYKTGRYLIENPAAAEIADKSFEKIIQARKLHGNKLLESTNKAALGPLEKEEEELAVAV